MPTVKLKIRNVYTLDGDKFKFRYCWKTRKGGNGFGLSNEGCMYTLNTIDQHMVAIIYGQKKSQEGRERQSVRQGC